MIYTLTLNPSLDYIVRVEDFRMGVVNRTAEELVLPGGKGLNVSMVLQNLGVASVALGFTAGFTGEEIERLLSERSVRTDFIRLPGGMSRINVKVKADRDAHGAIPEQQSVHDGATQHAEETEINGMGPSVGAGELERLFWKLEALSEGDILVLAGSVPTSVPKTVYADVMKRLSERGISMVVDATGEALLKVLPYHPFLIKPNHHELGALFGEDLVAACGGDPEALRESIVIHAKKLQALGARNVLVSMGAMGGMLVTAEGSCHYAEASEGKVINSVGAGDSMVAGFLAGYLQAKQEANASNEQIAQEALRWGLCAGSASAFSQNLATGEEIFRLLRRKGTTEYENSSILS